MELSSPQFWFILGIAALVIWIKMRKIKFEPMDRGRQITIRGTKLTTELAHNTPLPCLLDDGKIYGTDHKEKHPPQLPHLEGCSCATADISLDTIKLFTDKEKGEQTFPTDLGEVTGTELRYYKYSLIAKHEDTPEVEAKSYSELAKEMAVSEEFKQKVETHLNDSRN